MLSVCWWNCCENARDVLRGSHRPHPCCPISSSAKSVWVTSCRSWLLLMPRPFLCIYTHCIMHMSTGKRPSVGKRMSQLLKQGASQKSAYVRFIIHFITSLKQAQTFSRIKNDLTHMTKSVSIKRWWWDHSLFAPSGRSECVCLAILMQLHSFSSCSCLLLRTTEK